MSHLVFLDTETTSLDDVRGEVWEIGAIVRRDGQDDQEFLWQLWPDLSTADPNSLRIGRFYERNWLARRGGGLTIAIEMAIEGGEVLDPHLPDDARTGAQVARDLALILDGAHVVGAVPDFDYRFLRRWLAKYGQCWTAHYHLIDVQALAVGWLHGRHGEDFQLAQSVGAVENLSLPWKSTALYEAVGVDPKQFEAHTALGDAKLVRAVYDAITGGA